ncbi:unnamed protein product, partial [Mesorhabditis spiculigera]
MSAPSGHHHPLLCLADSWSTQPCSSTDYLADQGNDGLFSSASSSQPPARWPQASTPRRSLATSLIRPGNPKMHSPPLAQKTLPNSLLTPIQRTPNNNENMSPSSMIVTPSPNRLKRQRQAAGLLTTFPEMSYGSSGIEPWKDDDPSLLDVIEAPMERPREDLMISGGSMTPQHLTPLKSASSYDIKLETPSKLFPGDEQFDSDFLSLSMDTSGCFSSFASLSSIHRIPEMSTGPLETSVYNESPTRSVNRHHQLLFSPDQKPPVQIKRARRSLPVLHNPALDEALANPHPLHRIPVLYKAEPVDDPSIGVFNEESRDSTSSRIGVRDENEPPGGRKDFSTPKKPLKPFARRWLKIVCGTTGAQREVTRLAHDFYKRFAAEQPTQEA